MPNKKILFISNGILNEKENSLYLFEAFKRLPNCIIKIEYLFNTKPRINLFYKIFYKLRVPLDLNNLNQRILKKIKLFLPDILFIVKGNNVYPSTLKYIKLNYKTKIVSWSQDDMYNMINRSFFYTLGLKYYDLIVTQKSYNISELKKIGAKKVYFQNKAFCLKNHRPFLKISPKNIIDVLFIGSAEKERFEYMNFLAENDINIEIHGNGWDKKMYSSHHKNLVFKKEKIGDEYRKTISSCKIALCFLRKMNRDLQTDRTFEIPACGSFMLAERTTEHIKLFKEGKEAEFFSSKEELLKKIKYYLKNTYIRNQIAKAGYKRVLKDKQTYDQRVLDILKVIDED